MTVKEKLEQFMRDRKRSVDTATLAAYFMVSTSTINRCMKELEDAEKVQKDTTSRGKYVWSWNYRLDVAHKPIAKLQPQRAPVSCGTPFKAPTSYPNIRGYDD